MGHYPEPAESIMASSCYALASFLHKILSPHAGKSEPFVTNSGHFLQLLKSVNLHPLGPKIRFYTHTKQ
jgi:hypothetical protein